MTRLQQTTSAWNLSVIIMLWGCQKPPIPTGPSLAPTHNIYLRNSFDTDPSDHLGRFLPDALSELDESSGMTLACSEHVSWRFIDGGGVQTTEVLHTSSSTRARLGASGGAEATAGVEQTRAVRVSYTLTGKMVSIIEDPSAFAACCRSQPDQCSSRMVGEFIQGTGSVDIEIARGRDVEVSGFALGGSPSGGVSVSHGVAWRRAVEFPRPVYFAFKATPTPYEQGAVRTCSGWADPLPESAEGLYLRATSGPAWTEQGARQRARTALSEQAHAVTGITEDTDGVNPGIHEQDWCVEQFEHGGSIRFSAHVLGYMSHHDRDAARTPAAPAKKPAEKPAEEPNTSAPVVSACAGWAETPPVSTDGIFVVGRHALPSLTEQGARLKARANAHLQAGLATGLGSVALANGTAIGVQEREWCVVPSQAAGQVLYRAHVLGFVSEHEQDRIRSLPYPVTP